MALPGGGYVGSAVTKTNADVFIPELWSSEITRERDKQLVAAKYAKRIPFVGKKGDRLYIPRIQRMAVNTKAPETPVNLQARTETEWYIDITRYRESSFMLEDITTIQSAYNLRGEYTREVGYALARDLDNAVLGLRAAINNVAAQRIYNTVDGTLAGTASNPLNQAAILAAKEVLDKASVPQQGRVLIVGVEQYNDLLTVDEFQNFDYVQGSSVVQTGMVGRLYGMPVIMSDNLVTNSATGYVNGGGAAAGPTPGVTGSYYQPDQDTATTLPTTIGSDAAACQSAIMCHMDWAAVAMQLNPKMESSREVLFQADAVVATQLYGARVYRSDHAVVIHTRA